MAVSRRCPPRRCTPAEQATLDKGREIYTQVCFACHGDDGRGDADAGRACRARHGRRRWPRSPRVVGHRDYVIKALLHGLTGPIERHHLHRSDDPDGAEPGRLDRGDRVRTCATAFGNRAALDRHRRTSRACAPPPPRASTSRGRRRSSRRRCRARSSSQPAWKLTASHNAGDRRRNALSIHPWTSGTPQQPGMWLQVELPQPRSLTEIQFDSTALAVDSDADGARRADAHGHSGRRGARRARCRPAPSAAARIPAGLPGAGLDGRHDLGTAGRAAAKARARAPIIDLRAGARAIRPHHANRHRGQRAGLDDSATEVLD